MRSPVDLPLWLFRAAVVILVGAKLVHAAIFPPTEDEAYYWLWGQHLDFSYFDHAPFVGWAMAASETLLGWSTIGVRLGNFICLVGVALIFRHWARELSPSNWRRVFWASLAIYLASPLIFSVTSLAYPDSWLILFSLLSVHFFARFFAAQIDEGRLDLRSLYLGAVVLGLAALAKYNAVLIGCAVALTVIATPKLRPLLKNPHLYLAALVAVAMLTPILYWNVMHDFASFRFQLYARHDAGSFDAIHWDQLIRFVITTTLYASPFLVVGMIVLLVRRAGTGLFGALHRLGKWSIVTGLVPFLGIALFVPTPPHWALTAFFIPIGLAAFFLWSRWLTLGHIVLGTLAGVLVVVYYTHYVFANFGGDGEASRFYGWDQVGARMRQLAAEQGAAPTLAAYRWEATSKLGFALKTTDVTSLAPITDQYDFWRDEAALSGKDIVIVDEYGQGTGAFEPMFERVQVLESFGIMLHGNLLRSYSILIGRGYRPPSGSGGG